MSAAESKMGGFLPHVVLVGIAFVMVGMARAKHVSTEDAIAMAFDESADAETRIWGMHVAANRSTERDPKLGVDLARSMLSSEDERVREAALMVDLCRLAVRPAGEAVADNSPPLQDGYAYAKVKDGVLSPHRLRSIVLHRRKIGGTVVGGFLRLQLIEAKWFLASLRGGEIPTTTEMENHMSRRALLPGAKRDEKKRKKPR